MINETLLLSWLNEKVQINSEPYNDFRIERAIAYEDLIKEIQLGTFSPLKEGEQE